jgi:hypothetical protein
MRLCYWFGCAIDAQQQRVLETLARQRHITKSEVVRRLINRQAVRLGLATVEADDELVRDIVVETSRS